MLALLTHRGASASGSALELKQSECRELFINCLYNAYSHHRCFGKIKFHRKQQVFVAAAEQRQLTLLTTLTTLTMLTVGSHRATAPQRPARVLSAACWQVTDITVTYLPRN